MARLAVDKTSDGGTTKSGELHPLPPLNCTLSMFGKLHMINVSQFIFLFFESTLVSLNEKLTNVSI